MKDTSTYQFLGKLEKEAMEIIWQKKEPVTVRFVFETLSEKRKVAYTTIMTIMSRLAEKGVLQRVELGKAYVYQPKFSKDKFLSKVTKQIIKNFVSSFGEIAVAHFAQELEKIPANKKKKLLKMLKETK